MFLNIVLKYDTHKRIFKDKVYVPSQIISFLACVLKYLEAAYFSPLTPNSSNPHSSINFSPAPICLSYLQIYSTDIQTRYQDLCKASDGK